MSTPQRIMMISTHGYVAAEPELGKADTGGQVVYVLELSKCFGRMGYQVDILTRQFEQQPQEERLSDRVRLLRFPCGGSDFIPKETLCEHIPEWVTHANEYIKANNLEYTFINSHYWDAGLAGRDLGYQLHIPHIHTPHSIGSWKRDSMDEPAEVLEQKYNFRHRIQQEKTIYDECDAVIATTPQQRDILSKGEYDVPQDKIFVVPPGYEDTRFFPVSKSTREALKREHGLSGPIVMALGRMAHNKGFDLLIQSMPVVFQRVKNARLILAVGSSTPTVRESQQIAELKDIASKLGIAQRVIFRDHITDDMLADYYRMADVFALSSRYEPFGMTAVEAMACGTPTVITTEGGLWELVQWGTEVIYANPFDPEVFGHAITSVLQQPRVFDQLAKHGSQKARARFTWTGVAQQIITNIQNIPQRVGDVVSASAPSEGIESCKKEAYLLPT